MPKRTQSRLDRETNRDPKYLLAQQHLEKASRCLDDDEDKDEAEKSGNILMKIVIAFALVLWILTMIWIAKMALKKKEPAARIDNGNKGQSTLVISRSC